jgi:NADH-quinone oxidoreductase subunit N
VNFTLPALTPEFYLAASPILLLCLTAMFSLLMGVSKKCQSSKTIHLFNVGALLIATALACNNYCTGGAGLQTFLTGGYLGGRLGDFGQAMILLVALTVSVLMKDSYMGDKFNRGEIVAMFHMVLAGMLTMVSTDDLITLFVGLELASIGVYALIGYTRPTKLSQEAAVKYFVLGSIAAAILLFGFAFIFASTGSLRISEIAVSIAKIQSNPWARLGVILTLAGVGFKMALVPFHMWTADAYEGAPTGLTAFMATAMKVMIMIAAIRMFEHGLDSVHSVWIPALGFMAAASLILANIMALAQQSIKRLLAYSSIAHSGYMALALASMGGQSETHQVPAILFYLITYVLVSIGSFAIIMWLENERCDNLIIDDLAGLSKKYPRAAVALAIFMFSLGGMPPTVGFIAKYYIFNAALSNELISLVVIAAIGSTISLYYYMRLIVRMFMMDVNPALEHLIKPTKSFWTTAIATFCVVGIIVFGTVAPEPLMRLVKLASAEVSKDGVN